MLPCHTSLKEYISTLSPAAQAAAKSYLFNIFRANPWLARFYAAGLDILAANHCEIKDLPAESAKKFNPDSKGSDSMSTVQNVRVCTHIKVNGIRCGSPALRGEVFCYFHQRMFRGVRTPPNSRLHPIAMLEDEQSIQASLMEIINALVRNQIDVARARLIMRALHIAVKNAGKARFHSWEYDMVNEIPEYPRAPESTGPFGAAFAQAAALTTVHQPQEVESEPERLRGLFYTAPDDPRRRKPPASVKTTPRPRSTIRAGSSENKIRLRQLQPN
jgi:hypothetical protein